MPVYKDSNGTYKVRFKFKQFDGTIKCYQKRGFTKKSDASEYEAQIKYKLKGSTNMTLSSFYERYISDMTNRVKISTMETKKAIIKKWILPYLGNKQINNLTNNDILTWQNYLLSQKKNDKTFTSSYLKTIHNQLSAMLNHAKKYYGLQNNVAACVGNLGTDKNVKIDFWTLEEYEKFRAEISDNPVYYYAFEILYWCGIREGELFALTVDDIDFKNKIININKTLHVINGETIVTDPKTRTSKRKVLIPDFLIDEINDYLSMVYEPNDSERLFPLSKSMLSRAIDKYSKKAGVKRIRVHDLRHSHVSLLISLGFPALAIAQRVGHESIYITYHYAHLFPSINVELVDTLNNYGGFHE